MVRQKILGRTVLFHATLAIVAFCIHADRVAGQVIDPNDENWVYRHDIFQALLQRAGLTPASKAADVLTFPKEAAIVLMGDIRRESVGSWIKLKEFVDAGGRVLIAPDNFHSTVYFGEIQPGPVKAREEESQFSGFDDCVRVTRFRINHPLMAGIDELITNRSGAIRKSGLTGDWMNLAFLPDDCFPGEFGGKSILAIGETEEGGGVVVLSDPSVISNGMFSFADNGLLTSQLATYLSSENRTKLFLVVDNRPARLLPGIGAINNASRNPELNDPQQNDAAEPNPEPQFETLLEVANAAIQELVNPDDLNQRLKDQPRNVNRRQYMLLIVFAVATLILLWILSQLMSRPNRWIRYRRSAGTVTAESMLRNSYPGDVKNRIASEILAREFSREWTGSSTVPHWRQWLDDLKHVDRDSLPREDRVSLESLLAIAVFGGKTPMPDQELAKLSQQMCYLLQRYRQNATLIRQ